MQLVECKNCGNQAFVGELMTGYKTYIPYCNKCEGKMKCKHCGEIGNHQEVTVIVNGILGPNDRSVRKTKISLTPKIYVCVHCGKLFTW